MTDELYPCPCCGYLAFGGPPGSYEICKICFWEDDAVQLRFPDLAGGANAVSLVEAQRNYAAIGVSEARFRTHVRALGPEDARDPLWRLFDPARDKLEGADRIGSGAAPFHEPDKLEPTSLYYWRRRAR
jgi:hypothetical protein